MKIILKFIISFFVFITSILPQMNNLKSSNFQLSIQTAYQNWNNVNNESLTQQSNLLSMSYKISRNTLLRLGGGLAASEVLYSKLNGISDFQLQLNQKIPKLNTSIDVGVNIPSGNESLTQSEFASTILLSRDIFNIKMPVLGQGTNIFLGATWAKDLSDYFILGFGASYQIRGKYKPLKLMEYDYQPSNEVLLTAGIDFRIDKTKTISGDVIGVFYGKDKVDVDEVFSAGNRFVYNLTYRQYFDSNIWRVNFRYRYSAADEFDNSLSIVTEKVSPNHFIASTSFYHLLSELVALQYLLEGRFFEKTSMLYSGYNVYGVGLAVHLQISSLVQIPIITRYYLASNSGNNINGFEVGVGVNISF